MSAAVLPPRPLPANASAAGPVISTPDDAEYDRNGDYNRLIDRKHGEIELEGKPFRPSWILFCLDRPRYNAAVAKVKEKFKQRLLLEFPSPIAQAFDRFENRAPTPRERLDHLRNTWEALIWLLHALVVGEARLRRLPLKDARISRDGGLPQALSFQHLLSEGLAARLDVVKAILELAQQRSIPLAVSSLIPIPVVERIRLLNRVRNDLAHRSPLSPTQAQKKLAECQDEVIDILWKLKKVREVRLIRYNNHVGAVLKHEVFAGNSRFPPMKDLTLEANQHLEIGSYLLEGAMLGVVRERVVSLRPFVSCVEVEEGHARRLYIFKKFEHGTFQFEDLTTSLFHHDPKATFQDDLNELRSLFGLPPETV